MKRIIAVSTLAVATLVGFNSAASAADVTDTSTHSGTVTSVCSVKATNGTFATDASVTVNSVVFPTSLVSTGGKFETLCNKASNAISVANSGTNLLPTGAGTPTVTYDLAATSGAYTSNGILGTGKAIATASSGTIDHGFTNAAAPLGVVVKVAAPDTKILQEGTYTVAITATLTP
jgi:hypothetical protein